MPAFKRAHMHTVTHYRDSNRNRSDGVLEAQPTALIAGRGPTSMGETDTNLCGYAAAKFWSSRDLDRDLADDARYGRRADRPVHGTAGRATGTGSITSRFLRHGCGLGLGAGAASARRLQRTP